MAFHPKRFNFGIGGALRLQRVIRVALLIFPPSVTLQLGEIVPSEKQGQDS